MSNSSKKSVIVVGAGAAGLTAAIFAAEAGAHVTILERTDKPGKKILMSGGTRCNVLPVQMTLDDYSTDSSPNLLKRIFKSWSLNACKNWFENDLKVPLSCEIESNKWFPTSNEAREVRDALVNKVLELGVEFKYNSGVVKLYSTVDGWTIHDEKGALHSAEKVIIATGGLSVPTIGTDGLGHKALRQLGIKLRETYPALTPLTGSHPGNENLAGISLQVKMEVFSSDEKQQKLGVSNRDGFLFTHKGYSGPAVLDVSHFATKSLLRLCEKPDYRVNWNGEEPDVWKKRIDNAKGTTRNLIKDFLPRRLADAISDELPFSDKKIAELRREERTQLLNYLTSYPLKWSSNEGYRKAEVTGGGLSLESVDTATMQVKNFDGLYVCGEILDVFGRIGGFNFYWAWVTGRLAGKAVASK